jgi:FkbM family methyltransferase
MKGKIVWGMGLAAGIVAAAGAAFALSGWRPERPYVIGDAPRHVMIDGGAHRGETIRSFKAHRVYREHRWEIYAFECNPALLAGLPKDPDITLVPQAMWTEPTTLEFFATEETTMGSVYEEAGKERELRKTKISVEAIDFGQWLAGKFRPEDWIILKLDIEGAEYPILDQMIRDGSIGLVDMLFIEFHNDWVGIDEGRDEELTRQLRERGVQVYLARSDKDGDWF